MLLNKGGFEDTRLEAKDTKKIRGLRPTIRGQTLSRPNTVMLEAKDTTRKCSSNKQQAFAQTIPNFPRNSGVLQNKKRKKKIENVFT